MTDPTAAAARTLVSADDPLSTLSIKDYERDMAVSLHSALVAAQEAVRGFARFPATASRTYIYTGNKLNVMADPKVLALGIAKTGAAHFIWDCSIAYRQQGFKYVQSQCCRTDRSSNDFTDSTLLTSV